jgi:lipoate-protein ligase A
MPQNSMCWEIWKKFAEFFELNKVLQDEEDLAYSCWHEDRGRKLSMSFDYKTFFFWYIDFIIHLNVSVYLS